MPPSPVRPSWVARRRLRRALARHRAGLVAVLAVLALLAGLAAARPAAPPTVPVAVAAHDLEPGHPVERTDVRVVAFATGTVPDRAYSAATVPWGRLVAGPVRRGEPLTDAALVGPGLADGLADGEVLAALQVRASSAALVAAGDRVDVVAADPRGGSVARILADDATVVTVPAGRAQRDPATGVAPVVVAVPEAEALSLTGAAATLALDVLVGAPPIG